MNRGLPFAGVLALTTTLLGAQPDAQETRRHTFCPPVPVTVSNVEYPVASIAIGTVVLEAEVSEAGEVTEVTVVRDVVSLTPEAVRAVKTWRFNPATLDGKAVASRVTVAVAFGPNVNKPTDVPLTAQVSAPREARYVAPVIAAAAFPDFPLGGVAFGSVALSVSVGTRGAIAGIRTLHDIVSLTSEAQKAIKRWKFRAAQYDGRPVRAEVVVAFVFRLPAPHG
jgi:TonB family protein